MNPIPLQAVRDAYLLPYTDHTLNLYTHQLDRWFAWCQTRHIAALDAGRTDVEQYIQHLHREIGLQASSVHTCLTPVRGFYRFAYAEGIIVRDPAALARRPRNPKPYRDTVGLDRAQMQAFLEAGEPVVAGTWQPHISWRVRHCELPKRAR